MLILLEVFKGGRYEEHVQGICKAMHCFTQKAAEYADDASVGGYAI